MWVSSASRMSRSRGTWRTAVKALNRAAGYLRRRLGQEMRIRSVPELHFEHDASVETGQHMDDLIEAAIAADRHDSGDPDNTSEE